MRLIDLDAPKTVHLLCNLEPKWKPMAEFNPQTEMFEEIGTVIDAFRQLPEVRTEQWVLLEELAEAQKQVRDLTALTEQQKWQIKEWKKFAPYLATHGMLPIIEEGKPDET